MKKNHKIVAGGTVVLLALGLGLAAVGGTSAYFSDTNGGGAITVTAGSVYVDTDGSKTATSDIEYTNVLPGDTVTKDVEVENSGTSAQDVYLMVDPADLAAAKETIGAKGDLIVSVDGTQVAQLSTMGPEVLLASGLAADTGITVTFTLVASTGTTEQAPVPAHLYLPYSIVATQTSDAEPKA